MSARVGPSRIDRLLAPFSRVTSGGGFIPEIDGLRFFAILSVVLFHINGFLQAKTPVAFSPAADQSWVHLLARHGHYGVQLFFAISGFILTVPFAERHLSGRPGPGLGRYFKRRLTRLEPPYIANLLLVFALLVTVRGETVAGLLPNLLASMTYLHNAVFGDASQVNPVAWSLEVEVQFYLVAPALAAVFLIRRAWLRRFVVIGVAAAFASLPAAFPDRDFFLFLPGQLPYFLVGLLLADVFLVEWKRAPARGVAWDLVGTAAWAGMATVFLLDFHVEYALPVLVFLAYMGAFRGVVWNRIVRNRWLVVIGGMCYTTYLYHYYAISLLGRWTVPLRVTDLYAVNYAVQGVLIVLPTLVACALLFAALERPFMQRDWPARWRAALRGPRT